MARSERLLELLQALRRRRRPVTGQTLSQELNVSLRTLYRDIASLQSQGAPVEGEPGIGYVLKPGFTLPPLMFAEEEIEALVLGSRWVAERADDRLGLAARNALAKIEAVLPPDLRDALEGSQLLIGPGESAPPDIVDVSQVRVAIRTERKLEIAYGDGRGTVTQRLIWPFALTYFDHARVILAWCELREDFRHFRTDRISRMAPTSERYPGRRRALLKSWREQHGLAEDAADGI